MDHRIDVRQILPLTPLFPGLNLTYALNLLQLRTIFFLFTLRLVFPKIYVIKISTLNNSRKYVKKRPGPFNVTSEDSISYANLHSGSSLIY